MKRTFDLLDFTIDKFDKDIALAGKKGGSWVKYSSRDYKEIVDQISLGLMEKGIKKGDTIITMSTNCPEWNFIDMAIAQTGAVHVPVFTTILDNELKQIIREVKAKMFFASNKFFYNKAIKLLRSFTEDVQVFTFDKVKDANRYTQLIDLGKEAVNKEKLELVKNNITEQDVASIIYTSGTTTKPKGVVLTHKNHVTNFIAASATLKMNSSFVGLSYLPLCHVYERMINYMYQYLGIPIYYAESLTTIVDNFKEVKPHVVAAVPLFLEKIYGSIIKKQDELSGVKKSIFKWALRLAADYNPENRNIFYKLKIFIADLFVYRKIRKILGGNIKRIICGAAALQPKILKTFWAAGLHVHEGYGLTETSPLISVNHYGKVKLGTIGEILDGVEVKISSDGEILCKGPNVMLGYFEDQEKTREVVDSDGWFHTQDVGFLDEEGFLSITGRKKDMFKTTSGIYVSPEAIENKLKLSPFIENVLIIGANKNYLSAIIIPEKEFLKNWTITLDVQQDDIKELIKNQKVLNEYQLEIEKYNFDSPETERILKFILLDEDWTIESGDLTPSMKLKRNVLLEKYEQIIENFYEG